MGKGWENMDHQTIQDNLWLLNDAELPAQERQVLVDHLVGCPDCSEQVAQWALEQQTFSALPKTEKSDFFVQQTAERIRALPERRGAFTWPAWLSLPQWSPVFGAGLATVAICLVFIQGAAAVSTETLLLAGMPDTESWMFAATDADSAILLGLPTE